MAAETWVVADKLRGHYMRHEYGEVILPLTVLRRLDGVLAPTRRAVWDRDEVLAAQGVQNKERPLLVAAKLPFYNTSRFNFEKLISENDNKFVAKNLRPIQHDGLRLL
jgi:type I restriction enzyme M protein